jgi:lipopolysaccharide export system permease protein
MKRGRLRWLGRVDRYVLALFGWSYLTAFLLVVGLYLILDLAQSLDEIVEPFPDGSRPGALTIARYYLLQLPFLFLQVAPFVTLVAGLFTVGKLVRHNEVLAVMAAGASARRLLAPLALTALVLAALMFALREGASARLGERRDALRHLLMEKVSERKFENLWLRDGRGNVLRLGEFRPASAGQPAEVRDLTAHLVSATSWTSVSADRAVWDGSTTPGRWLLEGGVRQQVSEEQHSQPVHLLQGFEFTPELALTFRRAREAPLELSWAETVELARRDPDNVVYQTLLHYLVTFPLANLVLLLVGLPLLLRHERGRGARAAAGAFALCLTYFAADFVCRNLGLQGTLEPALSAWLPILFFGSLGIALYDSMRT